MASLGLIAYAVRTHHSPTLRQSWRMIRTMRRCAGQFHRRGANALGRPKMRVVSPMDQTPALQKHLMIRAPRIPFDVAINLLAGASALLAAVLVALPDAVPHVRAVWLLIYAMLALALAFWLPPHLFLGASLAVLALSSVFVPVSVASTQVYTYDVLLVLVVLRAVLPRDRRDSAVRILNPSVAVPAALWTVVMVIAGFRGGFAGNSPGAIARLEMPLVYFPLFTWGFTRILREKAVSVPGVVKALAITSLCFIGYAAFARLTHQRFGGAHGSGIGAVPSIGGELRRDYGIASAFQVYPLLALAGVAYLVFTRRWRFSATLVTTVSVAATFLTLIRGFIFGIVAGVIWMLVFAVKTRWHIRLASRLLPLLLMFALAVALFFTFSPRAAHGVAERVLPGILKQSRGATLSTQKRDQIFRTAARIAQDEPFGLGFVSNDALDKAGFPFVYRADNQWGTLLVYTGWPGVLLMVWAGVALVRRSSQLPAATPWLHPLVAATGLLVLVEGYGWNILFTFTYSLGMLALILACRLGFSQSGDPAASPHESSDPGRTTRSGRATALRS